MALVTRCSAIHFRGQSIRQVSYYTLLGGFRLPWPPSWCEYETAPFVVSGRRELKHLFQQLGSSPVANYAYQNGPTRDTQFAPDIRWSNTGIHTFQVWELVDCTKPPNPLVIRFTSYKYLPSYPEGNFEGNQLLDGSISLSPLYPCMTNDLHVSIATSLHLSFPRLHPSQA